MPLLAALESAAPRLTFALSIVYALVLGVGGLGLWLSRAAAAYFGIGDAAAIGYTLAFLVTIFAAHGAFLGLLLLGRPARPGPWAVVWCAAAWACWDVARTALWPRFPGGVLALSQHEVLPVLQVASVGGVAALTFLLVAVNAGVAGLVGRGARAVRALGAATGIALLVGALLWGRLRIASEADPASSAGPLVVAVDVGARAPADGTLERYLAASTDALTPPPALLVWPESALTTDVEHDRATWATLSAFVAAHGIPLLAGGPGAVPRAGRGFVHFNSAHLIAPGHGLRTYHKRGLVPFAERWPAAWPALLGTPPPDLRDLEPGTEATLFPLGDETFGVLICFEITDGRAAGDLARRGARFLVNLTNDAWFSPAPHLPWAAVRAVETGLPVVRAANAGVSAVFDRFGRPRSADAPGRLVVRVPAAVSTVYRRAGDAFLAGCAVVVLAGFLSALRGRRAEEPTRGRTPHRRHRALSW